MLAAIANIQAFVQGLDQEGFAKDAKTLRAVTYEFVVMGEAVARLPEEFLEAYPHLPWRAIKALRNYAVHEYFRLSPQVLWQIVSEELEPLRGCRKRVVSLKGDP
jgi:uncharacterized protein with HEPN domain